MRRTSAQATHYHSNGNEHSHDDDHEHGHAETDSQPSCNCVTAREKAAQFAQEIPYWNQHQLAAELFHALQCGTSCRYTVLEPVKDFGDTLKDEKSYNARSFRHHVLGFLASTPVVDELVRSIAIGPKMIPCVRTSNKAMCSGIGRHIRFRTNAAAWSRALF
ncbi:hypothetical protein M427DRAFT_352363 [Gonapodya prolifera JEL478]|uniref:Uncharacterized protein n=1 Tax=Gonapodya prolifera (strain JEL478) TaxID=1344416 RepID=A0A139ABY9_GONPJ|nr:hypothetical protein M427DRAFT_352363 [Gonapodya prolifera JEL478]|eukprot:KXS14248.1 hypothetical protein M427DRAFT_352363 [Gonapodya prolifera JEL478]